jgi:hypothetical protein
MYGDGKGLTPRYQAPTDQSHNFVADNFGDGKILIAVSLLLISILGYPLL